MQNMNPAHERKTIRIAANVTEDELGLIQAEMRRNDITSISAFCRLKILGNQAIPVIRFPAANIELSDSLKSLHSNLNQLIRQCHISGLDSDLTKELIRTAAMLNESTGELRALLKGSIPASAIRAMAYQILTKEDVIRLLKRTRMERTP